MAFTFVASAEAANSASATTLDASTSLNVAAGDVLVAWCKHEGANTTFAVAKNSGTPANTFTFDAADEVNHSNGSLNCSFGYLLSAEADATATFRMTLGAARTWRAFIVWQFRPDSGETVTKDASATGQGTSSGVAASGTITTTGTDEIVLGGYGEFTNQTLSAREINDVAADGFEDASTSDTSSWYRILTSTFTGGAADVTQSASAAWICNVIAIKSDGAATGQPTAKRFGGIPGMALNLGVW